MAPTNGVLHSGRFYYFSVVTDSHIPSVKT